MITLYSGTPGSGKSLHVAREIYYNLLKRKRSVIANFPIDYEHLTKNGKKKAGKFTYMDNSELTVESLYRYAYENHELGKEGQTIVIIDECQVLFNPREFDKRDRLPWITFFTQHRKLGYHFILISQNDRLVDRQIRSLFEYEVRHRKLNNFGAFALLYLLGGLKVFVAITYWYSVKEKVERKFFIYKKKHGKLYDSFLMFEGSIKGVDFKAKGEEQADQRLKKKKKPKISLKGLVAAYKVLKAAPRELILSYNAENMLALETGIAVAELDKDISPSLDEESETPDKESETPDEKSETPSSKINKLYARLKTAIGTLKKKKG